MVGKLAAVAIGGNSLILDPKQPDVQHQWDAVRVTCDHIANMIAEGWSVDRHARQRAAGRLHPAPR